VQVLEAYFRTALICSIATAVNGEREVLPLSSELVSQTTMIRCTISVMEKKSSNLGGARPGAGKKPQVAGAPATAPVTIKMSEQQKGKLQRLGGAPWVRDRIDKAKEPND
jgi:hypothetical protein